MTYPTLPTVDRRTVTRVDRVRRPEAATGVVSSVMERLCGRPGCSDPASVAYGMHAEDLVFWLDVLPDDDPGTSGVLCRRHSDSMVVPRGWTLDDLRDPDLHLFRPPSPAARVRSPRPAQAKIPDATGEQLRWTDDVLDSSVEPTVQSSVVEAGSGGIGLSSPDPGPGAWTPSFDEADDLDGLLSARSPLLARAFRTADRPDA